MANQYQVDHSNGQSYTVTTDRHHDSHTDRTSRASPWCDPRHLLHRDWRHGAAIHLQRPDVAAMRIFLSWPPRPLTAVLAVCACCLAGAASADHTDDAVTSANRSAYDWALKCFVANGSAAGTSKDGGDAPKAAAFEGRARTSFDTASALADKLGYSGSGSIRTWVLPKRESCQSSSRTSLTCRGTIATCKALGCSYRHFAALAAVAGP